MNFYRFTKYGFLPSWGFYTYHEREALKLVSEIEKLLRKNDWLKELHFLKNLIDNFDEIKIKNAILPGEVVGIISKLVNIKEHLDVYVNLPNCVAPVFNNSYAVNFHEEKKASCGSVISFEAEPKSFRNMIQSGRGFLWTLDVDCCLSIGIGELKHSIVANGKDVQGAGMGKQFFRSEEERRKRQRRDHVKELRESAKSLILAAKQKSNSNMRQNLLDNARYQNEAADEQEKSLGCWSPTFTTLERKVVLDFQSGHYGPKVEVAKAASKRGWNKAGYEVVWDPHSRWA